MHRGVGIVNFATRITWLVLAAVTGCISLPAMAEPRDENASVEPTVRVDQHAVARAPETLSVCLSDRELRNALLRAGASHHPGLTYSQCVRRAPALSESRFARLDYDRDGFLDWEDSVVFPEAPAGRIGDLMALAGSEAVDFEAAAAADPALTWPLFCQLDLDEDGLVSVADALLAERSGAAGDFDARAMQDVDANLDAAIDRGEWTQLVDGAADAASTTFDDYDRNGDDLIDARDFPACFIDARAAAARALSETDADFDGIATPQEAAKNRFSADQLHVLDADGDGVLTQLDLGGEPVPVASESRRKLLQHLAKADRSGDGRLDYIEVLELFPDAAAECLSLLDADGDGFLTRGDLLASAGIGAGGVKSLSDVNLDGRLNAVDIQTTVNHRMGRRTADLPADVDGDGRVTDADVFHVQRDILTRR
jgi:Ca2+-binding EF-hand superfamily protein